MGEFLKEKHIKYLNKYLWLMPTRQESFETSRLTVAFFAVSGLDILNGLDSLKEEEKKDIIKWVYSLQVLPLEEEDQKIRCGFRGSSSNGVYTTENQEHSAKCMYDSGHIAMTYSGLSILLILGDNLNRVNKSAIIKGLKYLQKSDGSFMPMFDNGENDMRFVYCAACISYILNDWSGMDVDKACEYIYRSMTYEGGLAQGPNLEAHGGSTFCAVAALTLMGRLHTTFSKKQLQQLLRWCLFKQEEGFQGRPNKPEDTCYSFWVGATLKLLDAYHFVDFEKNLRFVCSTQDDVTGGLCKWPDGIPDFLHTYLGISGLALGDVLDLAPVNAALNISDRAARHMLALHKS